MNGLEVYIIDIDLIGADSVFCQPKETLLTERLAVTVNEVVFYIIMPNKCFL